MSLLKGVHLGKETNTQETACEDEDRDWGEAKVMEHQKFPVNHYKLVEGNGIDSHSQVSEETNPTDKLILHF